MMLQPVQTTHHESYNAIGVIRQKQDSRFRRQHRFWLDTMKQADCWLDEQIEVLKSKRQYAQAVRDGLRLFLDLKAGRTTVLFELFPRLRAELENEILKDMLGDRAGGLVGVAPGPKPLGKVIPMIPSQPITPPEDDEMPTLVMRKADSDGKAASNFLDSAFSLQSGS